MPRMGSGVYKIRLTALASGRRIRVELIEGEAVLQSTVAEKGEDILKSIDKILKASKLGFTNATDFLVECEKGSSALSCQMIGAARETFLFARSVDRN